MMPTHIEDLQSTVEIEGDAEAPAAPPAAVPDEMSERARQEGYRRDAERLHADGYAD